jgi:hypothetical protein
MWSSASTRFSEQLSLLLFLESQFAAGNVDCRGWNSIELRCMDVCTAGPGDNGSRILPIKEVEEGEEKLKKKKKKRKKK